MTKQEFLQLFELEEIYEKYKDKVPFCFGLYDNLTGSENAIFYVFKSNKLKFVLEYENANTKIEKLEFHLFLNDDDDVKLNGYLQTEVGN